MPRGASTGGCQRRRRALAAACCWEGPPPGQVAASRRDGRAAAQVAERPRGVHLFGRARGDARAGVRHAPRERVSGLRDVLRGVCGLYSGVGVAERLFVTRKGLSGCVLVLYRHILAQRTDLQAQTRHLPPFSTQAATRKMLREAHSAGVALA